MSVSGSLDSGVRQGCMISTWIFNVYMDKVMKEVKSRIVRLGKSRDFVTSLMQMT